MVDRRLNDNSAWAQSCIHFILVLLGLVTLLPLVNIFAMSLSKASAIVVHPLMLVPHNFTLEAYKYIFQTPVLTRSFGITVFVTLVGTTLNLATTSLAAYGLSKTDLPGHKFLMWWVVIPMLLGAGLIPHYILLKNLGLLNSIWVLIVPSLVSPFNLILMRNFFWSIPESLEESARLDGANDLQTFWHIVLPLSKPVIATIGLFYGVSHWNDFFSGLFYLQDNAKWPLQVVLRSIIVDQNMLGMGSTGTADNQVTQAVVSPENIKTAAIIFSIVPVLLVYPFLQKYFVKGILLGSVKG